MQIGAARLLTDLYWTYCSSGDRVHFRCRSDGRRSAARAAVVCFAVGHGASVTDSPSSRGRPLMRPPTMNGDGGGGGGAAISVGAADWAIGER